MGRCPLEFPTTLWERGHTLSYRESGNRREKRALEKVIMPRQSRENTIEEKRRMRNQKKKRKRLSRTARERENREMRIQKERDAFSR